MANTIDADLLQDTVSTAVINVLSNRFAPFAAYTRDFNDGGIAPVQQTKNVQVPIISSTSSTVKNPTTFIGGDTVTGNLPVTVDAYSKPIHLTSAQLNQRIKLEMFAKAAANQFADDIMAVVTGKILDASISTTNEVVAQASFAAANAKSIWGKLGKVSEKHLILDSTAYAQLAPSDKNSFDLGARGAFGFDGIHHQTTWTGATANTYGIGCGPEFMAIYTDVPVMSESVRSRLTRQSNLVLPFGLTVQLNEWVDVNTRTDYMSLDVMFGAAVADGAAAVLILSA